MQTHDPQLLLVKVGQVLWILLPLVTLVNVWTSGFIVFTV